MCFQKGLLTMLSTATDQFALKNDDVECEFTLMIPYLAYEIQRARIEAGLTIEELLLDLREQREKYVTEKYGVIGNPGR